jgi:signal transduction histidine kinase
MTTSPLDSPNSLKKRSLLEKDPENDEAQKFNDFDDFDDEESGEFREWQKKTKVKKGTEIHLNVGKSIVASNSFNHNLVNVVSGINHEVSPWLGGAINTIARLRKEMNKELLKCPQCKDVKKNWLEKLQGVSDALNQATEVMAMVSFNVKRLRKHTVEKTSILNTVKSWFSIIFVNDTIKGAVCQKQILIEGPSLSFSAWHSPMFLSQVFLNLVKNSIDHNPKTLASLRIRIYGKNNCLIIEDNGTGVEPSILASLFIPEVTTKPDRDLHGLGLAICKEYCKIQGADIFAENVKPHGLRIRIRFAQD